MTFTKIGRIVGFVTVAFGLAAIVALFFFPLDIKALYFDWASFNFRQATVLVEQGSILIFFGLVLGVLCEISLKLEK